MIDARKTGKEEGLKEGVNQGIENGVLQRNREIVQKLNDENYSLEVISKITGLTQIEIEKLINS